MNARQAATFMRAFGDGTRLRIIGALSDAPMSMSKLARVLRCPKHRVSRHLTYLRARGVVQSEPVRNSVVYRLSGAKHAIHRRVLAAVQRCLGEIDEVLRDAARLAARRQA